MTQLPAGGTEIKCTFSSDLFARFATFMDVSKKSRETYTRALKSFSDWIDRNKIAQPQRVDVLRYRDELKAARKPATVQLYITAVKLFFRWTYQEGLYPNIADHVKGAKVSADPKKDPLTVAQAKALLDSVDQKTVIGVRNYALLLLMLDCGLRTVEVSRANIGDIGERGGVPVLYIQGKGHEEKDAFVKLVPSVFEALEDYRKERGERDPDAPLFVSHGNHTGGGRLSSKSISRIVKSAMLAAGLDSDRLTAHSTRHTAVTIARAGGMSLEDTASFARHSSIETTRIYDHSMNRLKNQCEETIAIELLGHV